MIEKWNQVYSKSLINKFLICTILAMRIFCKETKSTYCAVSIDLMRGDLLFNYPVEIFFFIWSEYVHSFKNDSTLMFKRFFSFHHTTSCINWVIIRPHHADIKKIAKFSNFSLISHRLVVWKKQKMKIVFACKVFRNKTMNAMHNNFLDKCTIKREADFESLDLIV